MRAKSTASLGLRTGSVVYGRDTGVGFMKRIGSVESISVLLLSLNPPHHIMQVVLCG